MCISAHFMSSYVPRNSTSPLPCSQSSDNLSELSTFLSLEHSYN